MHEAPHNFDAADSMAPGMLMAPSADDADVDGVDAAAAAARKLAKKAAKAVRKAAAEAVAAAPPAARLGTPMFAPKKTESGPAAKDAKAVAATGAACPPPPLKKLAKKRRAEDDSAADSPALSPPETPPKPAKKKAKAGTAVAVATPASAAVAPRLTDAAFCAAHHVSLTAEAGAKAHGPAVVFQTFDDCKGKYPESLVAALLAQGYSAPTAIQAAAWPVALAGRDLVAVAKTGSGKTCGYLLPALALIMAAGPAPKPPAVVPVSAYAAQAQWAFQQPARPRALVLAPTRELAIQIGAEAAKFLAAAGGAKCAVLYGGAPKTEQLRVLRQGADIAVATPGRLADFLAPQAGRSAAVAVDAATYLVLDEADRMLDMGFEPQIRKIVAACPAGESRRTLLFSATWPAAVQRLARAFLRPASTVHVRIGEGAAGGRLKANPSIAQTVEVVKEFEKLARAKAILRSSGGDKAIVFAGTKRKCDLLESELKKGGFTVAGAIHGDREQWDRERSLRSFRDATSPTILVATDVAARGLDIPGVACVVVHDFGKSVEDYCHRIGRTGRAGATGASFCLLTRNDAGVAKPLIGLLRDAGQAVPKCLEELAKEAGGGKGGGGGGGNKWRGGGGGRGGGGRRKW